MKRVVLIVVIVVSAFFLDSCRHQPDVFPSPSTGNDNPTVSNKCDADTVYFENDILPLLASSCGMAGCHDAVTKAEGLDVTTFAGIVNSGKVKAGNLNGSDLYEVITESDPNDVMPPPPRTKLTPDQIAKIGKWIQQGARNNKCSSGCDSSKFLFAANVKPIIDTNCKGCHSGTFPSANVRLEDYGQIKTYADNGLLLGTMSHATGFKPMPQGTPKLSDCQVAVVRKWIQAGAQNN